MRIKTVFLVVALTTIFVSCGDSGSSDVSFVQINPSDSVYQLEDLKALGIKRGKKYNVDGLEKATEAIFAFYKKPGTKEAIEYEIRFYENHDDAVNPGIPMVKERVGPDAKLKKDEAVWGEGLKDARQCGGAGGGVARGGSLAGGAGDHNVGSCSAPKYNEFFVFGNLVILCQGENEEESRNHCVDLITILNSD